MMIKVESTNRELLDLFRGLEAVKTIKGARFAILVGKNLKELKYKLTPIEEAAAPSIAFQEVSIQMRELMEAEDSDGVKKLEEENKELIEARKTQMAAIEDMLDAPTSVDLHKIREDQLPDEVTGEQIEKILELIV